jgi:Uma2 family endonuclease
MFMPMLKRRWTVEDLEDLPDDGNRYEIIDGELLVTPAPSMNHQEAVSRLHHILSEYLQGQPGIGHAYFSPADVTFSRTRSVQPDVFVVRLVDAKLPRYPFALSDLLLAVEVSSPNDPLYDYQTKRALYMPNGIPEYWVLNAEARNLSRWRRAADPGEVLSARVEWQPAGMPEPFALDLPSFFDDAVA